MSRAFVISIVASAFVLLLAAGVGMRLLANADTPAWAACKRTDKGENTAAWQAIVAGCSSFIASGDKSDKLERAYRLRGAALHGLEEDDQAIDDLNRATRIAPDDAEAFATLANIYLGRSQYDVAAANFTKALAIKPDNSEWFNDRGLAYRYAGDNDKAILDFDQAIDLDSKNAMAFANRGYAYLDRGQFVVAITNFDNALRITPRLIYALDGRGRASVSKRDFDAALADYNHALADDPENTQLLAGRGDAYAAKGDYDDAIKDLDQVETLSPNEDWPLLRRSNVYFGEGDYARAIADASTAIKLKPDDSAAWNSRCWARAVGRIDVEAAEADCKQALKINPEAADVMDSLGLAYLREGKTDLSIASYTAALAKNPRLPSSLYVRGIERIHSGDAAGGAADIAAAKAIKPGVVAEYAGYGVAP